MNNTETNRIALMTGANRGIGRSAAVHLAQDGVDVIVTYRSHAQEAEDVVSEIRALGRRAVALQLDLAVTRSFAGFADAVGAGLQPHVGTLTLDCQILTAENLTERLVVFTATPGSEDAHRLELLSVIGSQRFPTSAALGAA